MADFRKLFLVLIVGLFVASAVSAQVVTDYKCTASSVPTLVRAEGLAEMVGDIKLTCSGVIPNPAAGISLNIRATLSQNITSNILSGTVTEATLVLDKGRPTAGGFKGYQSVGPPLVPFTDGSQNVYQAVRISDTEVEWQGVVLAGPGSTVGAEEILLTNIRANASGAGAGSSISATINITTPTSVAIDNNSLVVANTRTGLTFTATGANNFKSCLAPSGVAVNLNFTEGFNIAFRPRTNNLAPAPPFNTHQVPSGSYADESGFNPTNFVTAALPGGGVLVAPTTIGLANQGTRLVSRIKGVPTGVTLSAPLTITTLNGLNFSLISGWSSDFSGGTVATSTAIAIDSLGNGTVVYEAMTYNTGTTSPFLTDVLTVPVTASYTVPGTPTSAGFTTTNGSFAPISTVATASALAPEPRFIDTASDKNAFTITLCRTILLFPFITNQADFDTGIAISNTTADPLGSLGAGAQAGACKLYYYGNTNGSAAPPVATTPVVPTGGQLVMILSGGGSVIANGGTATACTSCAAPGFQGYLFALCDFQFAHGFAYVSNIRAPYQGAMGYLPLIVPDQARVPNTFPVVAIGTGEQLAP
jgi:hypothetical protein